MPFKNSTRRPLAQQVAGILNLTMSGAYAFCGSFLLLSPSAGKIMPPEYIQGVGIALVVYGLFRAYRAYLQINNRKSIS